MSLTASSEDANELMRIAEATTGLPGYGVSPAFHTKLDEIIAKAVNDTDKVNRFEVIDHRQCVYCRGRCTANYLQKDGSYKEQPCDKCDGSGTKGGRVYGAFSNPETSNIKIELSYQDDDKTLKVFVSDK